MLLVSHQSEGPLVCKGSFNVHVRCRRWRRRRRWRWTSKIVFAWRRSALEEGEEEEEQQESFIQNRTRARRDSYRNGTNTLSRIAGFNQSADEISTPASRCLPSTCPCRSPRLGLGVWVVRRVIHTESTDCPLLDLDGQEEERVRGQEEGHVTCACVEIN